MPLAARRSRRVAWRLRLGLTMGRPATRGECLVNRALIVGTAILWLLPGCERAAPSTSGAPAGSSMPGARALDASQGIDPVVGVVRAWSEALSKHDLPVLARVYDDHVRSYGNDYPKAALLKIRENAFNEMPTYALAIEGPVTVTASDAGQFVARFAKRAGPANKTGEGRGRLTLRAREGAAPVITEEADENTAAPARPHTGPSLNLCAEVAERIVNALPEVRRVVDEGKRLADASDGGTTFGSTPQIFEGDDQLSADLGVFTGSRFQRKASYMVRSRNLYVEVMDKPVNVPSEALKEIAHACP